MQKILSSRPVLVVIVIIGALIGMGLLFGFLRPDAVPLPE